MGISIQNITQTGATLYYSGTSVDYTYRKDIDWYLDGRYVGSSVISPGDWGSNGCWLSGLTPGTYYGVRANITWYSGGGGTKVETSSFSTKAYTPIIHSVSCTPTKTTVWVDVNASYTTSYDYRLYYRDASGNTGSLVEEKTGRASSSISFEGLKAGTKYRMNVTARSSHGSNVWNRDFDTLPPIKPELTKFEISNITPNSVDLYAESKFGNRYKFTVQQKYNTSKEWSVDSKGEKVTISGLTPLTEHYAYVKAWSGDNVEEFWEREFTTERLVPVVINGLTATPTINSVWVVIDADNASHYDYRLYNGKADTGGILVEEKLNRVASSISFTGLKANKDYYVNVTAKNSGHSLSWNRNFKTVFNPRPSNWAWSNEARNAFTNNGYTNELKYTEWNDFVQRVKEFYMWYWNLSEDRENIESAKMTTTDKVLYATKFNKVRSSIGSMNSTGLIDFARGDNVMGWYFTMLETKMNEVKNQKSILEENYIPISLEESDIAYRTLFDQAYELHKKSKNNVSILEQKKGSGINAKKTN